MLNLKNIHKSFNLNTINEVSIFKDFNLSVNKGDFVSIIGSNGSGKTTLLNLVCGSLSPDFGKILIDDFDVTNIQDHKRYQQIGRVFQDTQSGTSPKMTLFENLSMADNKGKSWNLSKGINKEKIDYYKELLSSVGLGLENKLNTKLYNFSGGQRQVISLLMATMQPIKILILDEHTAALDPKTADLVMELTDKIIHEKNLTALMVTHNLNYALNYGNRILMMHEGNAIIDESNDNKKALILDDLLAKFYQISIERGNSI